MIVELRLRGRLQSSRLELAVGGRGTTVCMSTLTRLQDSFLLGDFLGGFGSIAGFVGLLCVARDCPVLMFGSGFR